MIKMMAKLVKQKKTRENPIEPKAGCSKRSIKLISLQPDLPGKKDKRFKL